MLLGFKKRFVPFVEEGSKTHTIRFKLKRGNRRAGEVCHCYTGLRQKGARLLGRWKCVKVEDIKVFECGDGRFSVWIGDSELTPDERDALAWRDGFRDIKPAPFVQMMRYWVETHAGGQGIAESFVNVRQGEPLAILKTNRGKYKTLAFEGDLIHWTRAGEVLP